MAERVIRVMLAEVAVDKFRRGPVLPSSAARFGTCCKGVTGLRHAGISDQGRTRTHNEDRWCAHDDLGLYVVSDGMGGTPAGEVASEIVVQALPAMVAEHLGGRPQDGAVPDASEGLCFVLSKLSADVREGSRAQPGLAGMGATAVVALVRDSAALIAHVGDSRAYLWRDGQLRRLWAGPQGLPRPEHRALMGIFIRYRKFRETDTDVEYHYGQSETDLYQRLVIDKSTTGVVVHAIRWATATVS